MAMLTEDFEISPEDGWVEVSTAPTACIIQPAHDLPYYVAIRATAPPASMHGVVRSDGQPFEISAGLAAGDDVYVRVARKPTDRPLLFSVIHNGT